MFRKTVRSLVGVAAVTAMMFSMSGCSGLSQQKQESVASFYSEYVKEATSLDNEQISAAYADLKKQNLSGQSTDAVRDVIFKRFAEVDPELFDKIAVEYGSYDNVGTTYSSILLMSLATKGQPITAELPLDAITETEDEELGGTVYEIDRSKITAPLPILAESSVTKVEKDSLPPVKIIRVDGEFQIVPDASSLNEIGIPNEKQQQ